MALYAFDGTWNLRDGRDVTDHIAPLDGGDLAPADGQDVPPPDEQDRETYRDTVETNVHRMCEFYPPKRYEHQEGVGTRFGRLGKVFGGAFGLGGRHRIRQMYQNLCYRYFVEDDPVIELVGFSRGAAQAVHFANLLHVHGLRNPKNKKHLLWWWSRDLGWTFRHPKKNEANDVANPKIHFMGLFDTVATFGWPLGPIRNASRVWKVWEVPPNVSRVRHAMALDEVRKTFELVRPKMAIPANATEDARQQREAELYEVWFRGAHANVGGGYLDRGLSDIALAWMMEQLLWTWKNVHKATHPDHDGIREALRLIEPGPPTDPTWIDTPRERLRPDPNGAIGRTRKLPRKPAWRSIPLAPHVHHSVVARRDNLVGDHYNLNRPLLRSMPGDVVLSLDPPLFHDRTVGEFALGIARALFARVPVRTTDWLRKEADDGYIYRGGPNGQEWIAEGTKAGRDDAAYSQLSFPGFVTATASWLRHAGDHEAVTAEVAGRLDLAYGLDNPDDPWFRTEQEAIEWVESVLELIWPLVPRDPSTEFLLSPIDLRWSPAAQAVPAERTSTSIPPAGAERVPAPR